MNRTRPGVLSVRAVNQYRRRDVLTYLGLRYYLHNTAARSDNWVEKVATDLVLTRTDSPYFRALHFKEMNSEGGIEHRTILLPGANEALAEAALLNQCSKHQEVFGNLPCVYSYELSQGKEKCGIFRHYIGGLWDRHQGIAQTCDEFPNGVVQYTDIKRFYPSIPTELALEVWKKRCEQAGIAETFRDLGEKLIDEHRAAGASDGSGVLTGPMFSHLIGNLVLRELDEYFSERLPAKYFRYVDDITLVGDTDTVAQSLAMVRDALANLGLDLHEDSSPKNIEVSASEWLEGRNDFLKSRREISWMTLIGDLKRFLLFNTEERENIQAAFRDEGFRIPIRDYSGAVYESSFLEGVSYWAKRQWFRRKIRQVSIQSLLYQANWLRKTYEEEFRDIIEGADELGGFGRKRRIPKLRYRASRLIYLATDGTLSDLYTAAGGLPELHFHSCVMEAIATGRIDNVLVQGTNAAQAAAQPMRAADMKVRANTETFTDAEEQALAIFQLNGVSVDCSNVKGGADSELLRFTGNGADPRLMKSENLFVRELACLHGLADEARHPSMLESVYDEDEELALDAIDQLHHSLSP